MTPKFMELRFSPAPSGFTLVELLIVVLVLALLSVIIMPQFSGTVNDAEISNLKSNLGLVRDAIQRYRLEHKQWPGNRQSSGGACANGGSAGSGGVNSEQSFHDQLLFYSNINGKTCSTTDSTYRFGPYLRARSFPPNPLSGSNNVVISLAGELGLSSARVDGQGGWIYDVNSGQFIVDDAAYDDL